MDVSTMDPHSAHLVVSLQLSDIASLLPSLSPGDQKAGFEALQTELQTQLSFLESRVLAVNLLAAENNRMRTDRARLLRFLDEERQAAADHDLALRLAGGSVDIESGREDAVKTSREYTEKSRAYAESIRARAGTRQRERDNATQDAADECTTKSEVEIRDRAPLNGIRTASANAPDTDIKGKEKMPEISLVGCVACADVVPEQDTLTLACKPDPHVYCHTCLRELFTASLFDTELFPPRCCKVSIPLDTCRAFLPKDFIKDFDLKVEETATPNPTYCFQPSCAKFIRPKDVDTGKEVGVCVFCASRTCVACKGEEHDGLCPEDPHVMLLLDVAKRSLWQQCKSCKNMVELAHGCFHMVCLCRHEFCYLCGLQWKTCKCPSAEENYVIRRQPINVAPPEPEPVPVAPVAPPPAKVPVPTAVASSSTQRSSPCTEHQWEEQTRVRDLSAVCQKCLADYLPWVLKCDNCKYTSCWRCTRNRA